MRRMVQWIAVLAAFSVIPLLLSCTDPQTGADDAAKQPDESHMVTADTALEHAGKHLDPSYVCPMHPQIVRDEPGSCPICGMDLVARVVEPEPAAAADETALEHAGKHLDPSYVCPMHPQIVRDEPGSCPICGMDLVARVVERKATARPPAVSLVPALRQMLGVRTARAEMRSLRGEIRTLGRIAYDETRITHVHPRAAGWMERLLIRAEGDPVRAGAVIGYLYAPEILSAQVDYLIALDQRQGRSNQIDNAKNRLRLLGLTETTIDRITREKKAENQVPVISPGEGVVTQLAVREGMYVMPDKEMVTVVDLDRIWVQVDIFESQIALAQVGQKAEIRVPAFPGRVWQGKVDYLYPELDEKTRTLRVRLAFANPDHLLRPNMFADVVIEGGRERAELVVPRSALIRTGRRDSLVIQEVPGRFRPRDVTIGRSYGDWVVIRSGLREGEQVVVSGQFLIDSESNLQSSFQRLSGD